MYGYRDVWPLMTYTLRPCDIHEGALLWAKTILTAFAGVVLPITVPRKYVPVTPQVFKLYVLSLRSLNACAGRFQRAQPGADSIVDLAAHICFLG